MWAGSEMAQRVTLREGSLGSWGSTQGCDGSCRRPARGVGWERKEGCSSLMDLHPWAVPFLFDPCVFSSKRLHSTLPVEKRVARREAGARQEAEREGASPHSTPGHARAPNGTAQARASTPTGAVAAAGPRCAGLPSPASAETGARTALRCGAATNRPGARTGTSTATPSSGRAARLLLTTPPWGLLLTTPPRGLPTGPGPLRAPTSGPLRRGPGPGLGGRRAGAAARPMGAALGWAQTAAQWSGPRPRRCSQAWRGRRAIDGPGGQWEAARGGG